MKIVLTGGHGQLARDCALILDRKYEVVSLGSSELDITDSDQVRDRIRDLAPDVLLNCAAYTKVDNSEIEKDIAWQVNAVGPENLAAAMKENGGLLIHLSTDYVFDGRKKYPLGYSEADIPSPLSYYGKSKLAGEQAVCKLTDRHLIIRTAWLYGMYGANFLKTMLRLAVRRPGKALQVVNDQFGSFTWTYRLALQIERLIEAEVVGTYHATAEGYASWFEGALLFLKQMNVPHNISPCSTDQYPTPAPRPINSILENRRLQKESLCLMQPWDEDIRRFVEIFREDLLKEAYG